VLKTVDYKILMTDGSDEVTPNGFNPNSACAFLEHGGIIFFPETPFNISKSDRQFLLSQKQKDADYHKNIAYRPKEDRVTGFDARDAKDAQRLREIMADFHGQVYSFLEQFLAPYARDWKADFATFRPIEEQGRKMRLRARNDLLHVDSFATRPIYGDRILRTFINLNPSVSRVWHTSDTFETLANRFVGAIKPPKSLNSTPVQPSAIQMMAQKLGFKSNSNSPYDSWMLNFHNFLKENSDFQTSCRKNRWEFPPNSSWIVFTDMVSHAVLSGQYAMEQTFIVSQNDLVCPEKAPINILRRLYRIR
jgi:hypothetical protein